jgi:heme-degrading monooxygenase HmoA
MFARVSTYEGGDPANKATSLKFLQDYVVPAARAMGGWKGLYFLGDPGSPKTVSITLWDSEQSLQASEEAANKLRAEGTQKAGSQTVQVQRFEVFTTDTTPPSDTTESGAFARVSRYQIPLEKVNVAISQASPTAPQVRGIPGNTGGYLLIDRKTGTALSVTLWESEEALEASVEQANKIRAQITERLGGSISSVESFMVAATAGEHASVFSKA